MGLNWQLKAEEVHEGGKRGIPTALFSPLGIGTESKQRPRQKICCRAGDETEELDLEE